jgi:AraC-like DNA-binding protein
LQLARYFQLVGNPVSIDSHEDCDPIRVEMTGSSQPFSVEYTTALMILHFGNETEGEFVAGKISFQHKPDNVVEFERVLGCPVEPLASSNAITVPRDMWRLTLRRRDPVLRQMLEEQANDILARLPARCGLAFEVQRVLAARIAGGDTQIGAIARQLGVSVRTLQRRLAAEGVSYQELLDDARKEAAERYMTGSGFAICEIAYLLGFSEPAPFHRAFKRWYGMTPEGFRQKQREGRS